MTTTASSPRSYGNRHKEKLFHKSLAIFSFVFFSRLLPSTPDWRNYPAALSPLFLLRRQMGRKGAALVQSRGLLSQILRRTWKRRRRDGRPIRLSALFLGSSPHDLIATFCKSTIQFSTPGIKSGADIWGCEGGGWLRCPGSLSRLRSPLAPIGHIPSHGENPNVTYIPVIRFRTVMIAPVFCQRVRVDPVDQGSPTSFWR